MSKHQQQDHGPDPAADPASGEVSETGFEGEAPDLDADAVPSEHTTAGQEDADI